MPTANFPLLYGSRGVPDGAPKTVPWDLVAPHEARARRNHGGQTLARLAERGGLSPLEMMAVLTDRDWYDAIYRDGRTEGWAIAELKKLLSETRTVKKTYAYHKPSADGLAKITRLREAFSRLHEEVEAVAPISRERSVALTELETAAMWAIKAVVVNDPESEAST